MEPTDPWNADPVEIALAASIHGLLLAVFGASMIPLIVIGLATVRSILTDTRMLLRGGHEGARTGPVRLHRWAWLSLPRSAHRRRYLRVLTSAVVSRTTRRS
jgi:hypothetical protein